MSEHDDEPIRGLPGHLPPGEQILWQGAPDWRVLARTGIHAHWVAIYFVGLALWNLVNGALSGAPLLSLIGNAALTLAVGSVGVGLLVLYAVLSARTTVY
ncbi:MAG: PH domain-containing protein, partial [Caulobacteraceae bacterium]|nr:PH domain-containing protein [Caulobacteraceae bacterium]